MSELPADLAPVLGSIPSGLFIVTAKDSSGRTTGMLASWVQQAGFEPPAMTVAVKNGRYLNDWLQQTQRLAVSIVAASQKGLLGQYGKGFEPDEDAFDGIETAQTSDGIPVLSDAIGWLAGDVSGAIDAGDHTVYVVTLTEAGRGKRLGGEQPWTHIRKSGLGY
jgi:flavin reductase (DIM6/NTAB) family NADH-FMN oxidoreductase RutF